MTVDPMLLELLRCPDEHHAELTYDATAQTLTCTECGRVFEIRDGIPILLLDDDLDDHATARVPVKERVAPEDEEKS